LPTSESCPIGSGIDLAIDEMNGLIAEHSASSVGKLTNRFGAIAAFSRWHISHDCLSPF